MTKGKRIKHLRENKGINQTDLAKKIGVSKQTLYKYENDIVTNIPSNIIELIAEELKTTPWHIMGWDEPVAPVLSEEIELIEIYHSFNVEGQEKLLEYARLLQRDRSYIKNSTDNVV